MNKQYTLFLFVITAWIILTFNFKNNIFYTASDYFDYFQYDSESLVIGRLILSERDGLTAHAAFLGRVQPIPSGTNPYWYQYESYRNKYDFENFEAYYSQSGMQAFLYGLFCKITGITGDKAVEFYYWLVSLFTALIFAIFLAWVYCRWGLATAVFTFVTILFSHWITYFGRNIFWVLGIFFFPFVMSLWYLQSIEPRIKKPYRVTFWLMFICMFLKCLLTGFEYITTTLVMCVTPWIFYAFIYQWNLKSFLKRFFTASAGAITAVVATIFWLAIQLSFVKGSLGEGFRYIFYSFNRRTYTGGNKNMDPQFLESLDSNLGEVLTTYWNGYAYELTHWFDTGWAQSASRISFGSCVVIFLIVSLIVFLSKSMRAFPSFYRQQIALTSMLWVSFLAPLSWFVIFKGHSYVHPHMNYIVWYMPFMLLGAILTGSTFYFFIRKSN